MFVFSHKIGNEILQTDMFMKKNVIVDGFITIKINYFYQFSNVVY